MAGSDSGGAPRTVVVGAPAEPGQAEVMVFASVWHLGQEASFLPRSGGHESNPAGGLIISLVLLPQSVRPGAVDA